MKACFKCGRCLRLSEFYVHPRMGDGHLNKCKRCTKKDSKTRYWNKRESVLAYDRERNKLEYRQEKNRAWAIKNANKVRVQRIAQAALSCGKITRKPCVRCGSKKSEMHHPDYRSPLRVVWLCRSHHRLEHVRT